MNLGQCLPAVESLLKFSKNSSQHAATSPKTETGGIYQKKYLPRQLLCTPRSPRKATAFPGRCQEEVFPRKRLAARPGASPYGPGLAEKKNAPLRAIRFCPPRSRSETGPSQQRQFRGSQMPSSPNSSCP